MPNVVIIGAGFAGLPAALQLDKELPSTYNLILIDKRDFYFHVIAGLRAPLEKEVAEQSCIPYDRVFAKSSRSKVVKGTVTKITESRVLVDTGKDVSEGNLEKEDMIEYEYLVIATGCTWPEALDLPSARTEALSKLSTQGSEIRASSRILIVGGGAVGVELAGEIAEAYPEKKVILVHRGRGLLPDIYPDKLRNSLQMQLERLGVEVRMGVTVEGDKRSGSITTTDGSPAIEADLVFYTKGGTLNTSLISNFDSSTIAQNGSVKIDDYMQLIGHPNIFVCGDIADTKNEQKQATKAKSHAGVVAQNILGYIRTGKPVKKYGGSSELILVTVGKKGGAGLMFGWNVGSFMSRKIKSGSLFISQSRSALSY